jgi:hypothetical protein
VTEQIRQIDVEPRLIRLDGGTQVRVAPNQEAIDDYAQRMIDGDEFPPVDVFCDESAVLWAADGHHRVMAALKACKQTIRANVHLGSVRDAILFACGANQTNGLRRTYQDKRKAVGTLLADPKWRKRSDRWIAEACGVGHPLVADVRKATATQLEDLPVDDRVGRDGKVRRRRKAADPAGYEKFKKRERAAERRRRKSDLPDPASPDSPVDAPAPQSPPAADVPVADTPVADPGPAPVAETPVGPPDVDALDFFREAVKHYEAIPLCRVEHLAMLDRVPGGTPAGKCLVAFNAMNKAIEKFMRVVSEQSQQGW